VGLYAAPTQRFERGVMFTSADRARVYVLYADGQWE
jgi:hypothetical protein